MSAGKRLKTIYEHDWEKFGQAMASSHFVTKELVNRIADKARLTSSGKEQIFGNVYMMRLAISLLLLSSSALAGVQTSYDNLNAMFSTCSATEPIKGNMRDKWLESQSEAVIKTMLLTLKHRAFQQCIAEADKEYLYQSFLVYINTGNRELLDIYLSLRENDVLQSQKQYIDAEFLDNADRLAKLSVFSTNFDTLQAYEEFKRQVNNSLSPVDRKLNSPKSRN